MSQVFMFLKITATTGSWPTTNLLPANNTRVVSIRWSTTTPGLIYMYASPTTGYSGIIFRGTFDKATDSINWEQVANLGKGAYAGNATPPGEGSGVDGDGDGPNHPRPTGRKMMLLDEENGFLYTAQQSTEFTAST